MTTLTLGLLRNKQQFKDFEISEKTHYFLSQKEMEYADLNATIRCELRRFENGTKLKFLNKKVCKEILSWVYSNGKKNNPLLNLWVWSF